MCHRLPPVVAGIALSSTMAAGSAQAQTRAGTAIVNVAQAQGSVSGNPVAAASNLASFLVAERLDVALTSGDRRTPSTLPATLVNRGNGGEAFAVAVTAPDGVAIRGIAIDVDGDGAYDPAHDTLLTQGTTPALDPSATLPLLVLIDAAASAGRAATVTLTTRAVTGSGAPGTVVTGGGDGGSDAVVGPTGAIARVEFPLDPAAAATPTLLKSQSVRAPDGSTQPVAGAIVTYTLQATFADRRVAVRIDDPIPAGTRYVAGSLTLDGAALTDAADGDAGTADGASVGVALGNIVAPANPATSITHTVQFQVVLQ